MEGRFQNKIQTAVSGTESTLKTDTGKITNRKFISGPLFQTERTARKEPAINTSGDKPQKQTLLEGFEREIWPMGRDPTGHPERQIKNRTKTETTGK